MPRPRATLEATLAQSGFQLAATVPEHASLDVQWRTALASDATVFFVAGGDGTLRTAALHLADTGRILAPLPGGTMNRFVARLGLPDNPIATIAAHRNGLIHDIALARVNGEPFLYQCVVGRVTWLMRLRERGRGSGWRGWLRLARGVVREILRPRLPRVLIARLGPSRRARGHTLVITAPSAHEPPELCLNLAPNRALLVRLRQAWRWFHGRLAEDPDILVRRDTRLAVTSAARSVRLSLDGELHQMTVPLRFQLQPRALRVLAPPGPPPP